MTSDHGEAVKPQWDQSDRLLKSLRVADMSTGDMARYLGVTTQTIRNYIEQPDKVSVAVRLAWATKTGVDFDWLWTESHRQDADFTENVQRTRDRESIPTVRKAVPGTATPPRGNTRSSKDALSYDEEPRRI